jgi:thioesterase domain-containing protein
VRKDPDGSYDVFGTKAGASVAFEVSADLQTITENTGHGGGHR